MNPSKYKRNKRHLIVQQLQSKKLKTQSVTVRNNAASGSRSYVTPLSEVKNSPENRSFSGLDYDLMKDMFKGRGRQLLEAAQALRDSPPTVSDFDYSEGQAQNKHDFELPDTPSMTISHSLPSKSMTARNLELTSNICITQQTNNDFLDVSASLSTDEIYKSTPHASKLTEIPAVPRHATDVPIPSFINDLTSGSKSTGLPQKCIPPHMHESPVPCDKTIADITSSHGPTNTPAPSTNYGTLTNMASSQFSDALLACPISSVITRVSSCDINEDDFSNTNTSVPTYQELEPSQKKSYIELTTVRQNSELDMVSEVPIPQTRERPFIATPTSVLPESLRKENTSSTRHELISTCNKTYTELQTGNQNTEFDEVDLFRGNSPSLLCDADISALIRNNCSGSPNFTLLDDNDVTDCETPVKEIPVMPSCSSSYPVPFNISPDYNNYSSSEKDDSDADPNYVSCPNNDYENNDSDSDQSSSSVINNKITVPKTRKRLGNPALWKRNIVKKLKNSGQEYTNVKGNQVQAKSIGLPCSDNCKYKCSTKFNASDREQTFKQFWALADITKQRGFILNLLETVNPKYRYAEQKENRKPRRLNRAFYCYKDEHKERVCKIFLTSTLGISEKFIRTALQKAEDGSFSIDELRGRHDNHPKVPEARKDGARDHIIHVPKVESHYVRASSTKEYIEGGHALTDLYNDYKKDCQERGKEFVSISMYRKLFNYEFNFGFFKPKKDLCQYCEKYKNSTNDEKLDGEIEHMRHHEEKDLARDEKASDKLKISKNYKVACFDLQAALPTPNGEVSTFYYKSKLSTFNFTVVELTANEGLGPVNCYVWHEGHGNKGSTEIGSCLIDYLKKCASESSDEIEVIFYSDNCTGQNKNRYLITAYLYAVANLNIKAITHKFLIVGHTQNEGDVCHSVIEKSIKKSLRARPVYVPSQYVTLISTAKKTGKSFVVHELDHDFFVNLKELAELTTTNFNADCDGNKFLFNDICAVRVEKEQPGKYFYKTSYKDDYKTVDITSTRTRKQLKKFTDVELTKAYSAAISIPNKKYKDLMSLVKSKTIPQYYSGFYENLKHD